MRILLAFHFLAAAEVFTFTAASSHNNYSQVVRRDLEFPAPSGPILVLCSHESGVDDAPANDCAQMQQKIPYDDSIVTDPMKGLRTVELKVLGQILVFFEFGTCAFGVGVTQTIGRNGVDMGSGPYTGKRGFDAVGAAFFCNNDGLVSAALSVDAGNFHVGNIHE
jgi:hypothetical protein